jgi:hypothetical protein
MPEASVPSADTVLSYIQTANSIEEVLSFFRALNSVFLPLLKIRGTPQDFAIDFHNEGYYGDKNAEGVRGIQPKNGTSWGTFISPSTGWLGGPTHTLDVVNVTGLDKDYAADKDDGAASKGNLRGSRVFQPHLSSMNSALTSSWRRRRTSG